MKTRLILALCFIIAISNQPQAQKNCSSFPYQQDQLRTNPSLSDNFNAIESFIRQQVAASPSMAERGSGTGADNVIRIPVVVHILYHDPSQNISDAKVRSQIEVLNRCFRRTNADTTKTPAAFKSVAADCEIEFKLATSDPKRRYTTGIIRKYTPIAVWEDNDLMKFSAEMGDDAWDSRQYLNIWVCNMSRVAGYATAPGSDAAKDGIVLGFNVFGTGGAHGFDMGKTAVHEVGHWLNLRHLWGDESCGDDLVHDTPKQGYYNTDCPSGVHSSCSNGPNGDMYMNYMDFTNDACMNLFTLGQKARMRACFAQGGPRNSILSSVGLLAPLIMEIPTQEQAPKWLFAQLYPNPAANSLTIDLSYDARWIGKTLLVNNLQGQTVMQIAVSAKIQQIDISKLKPGMYFITGKKENGDAIQHKFIKL